MDLFVEPTNDCLFFFKATTTAAAAVRTAGVIESTLSLDVQLGTIGAQVCIADRSWDGNHLSGANALVARDEAETLYLISCSNKIELQFETVNRSSLTLHLEIISKNDVLCGFRGTLEKNQISYYVGQEMTSESYQW